MNRIAQFGAGLRLRDLYNYKQIGDQSRQLTSGMRDLAGKQDAVTQAMASLETAYAYYVQTYNQYQELNTQLQILNQQTALGQKRLETPPVADPKPVATAPATTNPVAPGTTPATPSTDAPVGPTGPNKQQSSTRANTRLAAGVPGGAVNTLKTVVDDAGSAVGSAAEKGLGAFQGAKGANLKTALKWAGAGVALLSAYKLGGAAAGDSADASKPLTVTEAAQLKTLVDGAEKTKVQIQTLMPRIQQEMQEAYRNAAAAKKELDTSFQDYATTVGTIKKQQTSLSQLMQSSGDWVEELSNRRNQEAG